MLKWMKRKPVSPEQALREALGDQPLPTFSRVALDAARRLRDPDEPLPRIASVLRNDPGISAGLLRLTNAPAYGLRSQVRNIEHAVSLLGRAQTESAVLSAAARAALPMGACRGFDPHAFWSVSATRAFAAKGLGKALGFAGTSELFTAVLLQDMAIPLLRRAHGDAYADILEAWHSEEAPLYELERARLGLDHAEVAAVICSEWCFPEAITAGVASHHGEASEPLSQLGALVAPLASLDDAQAVAVVVQAAADNLALDPALVATIFQQACQAGPTLADQLI